MAGSRTTAPAWIERQRRAAVKKAVDNARWTQADANQARALLERAKNDPVFFNSHILGNGNAFGGALPMGVTEQQQTVLYALRDHQRVAVRSGNGLGKTFLSAIAMLWFGSTRETLGFTTAPTAEHVKTKLWGEVRTQYAKSVIPLGGKMLTTEWQIGPKWKIVGMSTNNPSNFQGGHHENILIIFDECQDIPPAIWEAAESMMQDSRARFLVIGNPLEAKGPFYRAFRARSEWHGITLDAHDHPNYIARKQIIPGATTYDWCEQRREQWGDKDPRYIARVRGQFPDAGSDRVIPLGFLESAQAQGTEHPSRDFGVHLGVDVARYGTDETVIGVCVDGFYKHEERLSSMSGSEIAGWTRKIARQWGIPKRESRERIHVDEIGVGASVVDALDDMGWPCDPVNFAASPRNSWDDITGPQESRNLRADLYWATRELIKQGHVIVPEVFGETWEELTEPGYTYPRGKLTIEPKEKVTKRLGRSPDGADAVVLCQARANYRRPRVIVG